MSFVDRVRGALGLGGPPAVAPLALEERKAPKLFRGEPSRLVAELPLFLQLRRIGGNLTPLAVSEILRSADSGYLQRKVDLANEGRRKDGHLQAVLQTRETALSGLAWQVVPGGKKARDKRAATLCTDALRQFDELPRLIAHTTGGVYHGHAVAELLYVKEGGKLLPRRHEPVHARRFVYAQATGRLHHWDAGGGASAGGYPGIDLQTSYPGRFVQFQPRVNGDAPAVEGLSEVLLWAALFRNWDIKDWLSLGELAWKPWRIGTYKGGSDKRQFDDMLAILDQLTSSGTAAIPDTSKIDIQFAKATSSGQPTHSELFAVLGAEMSKAVLGQTLTTEQGQRGSQALGRVHDTIRRDILESDATQVAACLRRDVLSWIVRLNLGADVAVPHLQFLTEDGIELNNYALGILNLRKAGLQIAAKDVRDAAGLSEPDPGDELLGDGAPAAPGDAPPAGSGAPAPAADVPPPADGPAAA